MDPASVIGLTAATVQLATVLTQIFKAIRDVKDVPEELQDLGHQFDIFKRYLKAWDAWVKLYHRKLDFPTDTGSGEKLDIWSLGLSNQAHAERTMRGIETFLARFGLHELKEDRSASVRERIWRRFMVLFNRPEFALQSGKMRFTLTLLNLHGTMLQMNFCAKCFKQTSLPEFIFQL